MKRVAGFLAAACLLAAAAHAQTATRTPHIGFVYPAGGQQGTEFTVIVGGQYLTGVKAAWISGTGVSAEIVYHARFIRMLNGDQKKILQRRLIECRAKLNGEKLKPFPKSLDVPEGVSLPAHPLLDTLDQMNLAELDAVEKQFLKFDPKKQPNAQIGETVKLKITVAPDAAPGDRELRLDTNTVLTNALCFQIGPYPEVRETEPNDPRPFGVVKPVPFDVPVVINGQVDPGDVDRIPFTAKQGQRLVVQAQARHLIPFLADAVPGWFQATLSLYDEAGRELAFADDFRFHPDPVLYYEIPRDGVYEVEIRDSIYRGREDFVYRIVVAERPFITEIFPLGGKADTPVTASIGGWNLPKDTLELNTAPQGPLLREAVLRSKSGISNPVPYTVGSLPELSDNEPNNTPDLAQAVTMPAVVNGRIDSPGDTDVYRVEGKAGTKLVAEVVARRLYSPMDALVRVTDAEGTVLAWNDDIEVIEGDLRIDAGLMTDPADPYLMVDLPKDGTYYVHILDTRNQGSAAHAYRLRISPPRPDFELRVTPPAAVVKPGDATMLQIYVLRKDGFQGAINLAAQSRVAGFAIDGGLIQPGQDRAHILLTAPPDPLARPIPVDIVGTATVGTREIRHVAQPTEDMMQAFLWRHLVPVQELSVAVRGTPKKSTPRVTLLKNEPVAIPEGGSAWVLMKAAANTNTRNVRLELRNPPEGVKIQKTTVVEGGLTLVLAADAALAPAGTADNLFVEAFMMVDEKDKKGKPTGRKTRYSLGLLPAIPFHVVKR